MSFVIARPKALASAVSFARVMGPLFGHELGTTCLAQWG